MKGIYTIFNDKVYRINQDTSVPLSDIQRVSGNSMAVTEDSTAKTTIADIYLTDFVPATAKSNKEKYEEFVQYLTDKEVKEIGLLQDAFFISVDYTVYNAEEKEIEHSVVIRPMRVKDFIYPLGVNSENECVYRRFKHLTTYVEWMITNKLPYGIMCKKNPKTYLKINDITIWQDKVLNTDEHNSIYSQPFNKNRCTCTIDSSLENKVPVFSTKTEGIELQEIVNNFQPRVIGLTVNLDISNIIVVYDTKTIDDIINRNNGIDNTTPLDGNSSNTSNNCNCNCNCQNNSSSDDTTSDTTNTDNTGDNTGTTENGDETTTTGDTYIKVSSERNGALVVVSDDIADEQFESDSMIKYSDIVKYISDIEIGDRVLKVE